MTNNEIVAQHKFRNPAVERLVTEYVTNGAVDPTGYTDDEIKACLTEFAKDRIRWAKSNHISGERAKAGRRAEQEAKSIYARFGGKSVKATLNDEERAEYDKARDFLSRLGYDV